MKKDRIYLTKERLLQGLAGMLLSVSALVLPVTGYAENVKPQQEPVSAGTADTRGAEPAQGNRGPVVPTYVMPQEQVYLDPSQVEAAKKQLEADAYYNANPQNAAPVSEKAVEQKEEATKPVAEEKVAKEISAEVTKPAAEEKVTKETSAEVTKPAAEEKVAKETSAEVTKPVAEEKVAIETVKKEIADEKQISVAENKEIVVAKTEAEEKSKTETKENVEVKTKTEIATEPEIKSEAKSEFNTEEKPEVKSEVNEIKPEATQPAESIVPGKKSIQIRRFGTAKEFVTHHNTVADVLKDMKINMEGRSSYPSSETKITDGMVIHVLGRKSFVSHEEVEVPFQTKTIDDPELTFGEKKVEKAGVKGKDIVTYENITRIGYEQKIELDRRHVTAPVDEIVRQGIAQSVLTPEGYKRYKKKIYGEATAYTWGGGASGTTSLGLWPKRGIAAVDPRMIPYYTKMYIPGYGMAIAGDTGGAIVGHRIDLFMESLYECYQWGRVTWKFIFWNKF